MNKMKFTSWGVSFSSLALVAGMISYLGITNKNTASQTNTAAQSQAVTQPYQSDRNQDSSISYVVPNQKTDNSGSKQSNDDSSSFSSQHGDFDTTTGGS